jgi:hypothetical protein
MHIIMLPQGINDNSILTLVSGSPHYVIVVTPHVGMLRFS